MIAGTVLLAAAVLKWYTGGAMPYIPGGFAVRASVWSAFEAIVGLVAIAAAGRRYVHVVLACTFAILFALALYLTLAGYPSCGCFGAIRVPPLLAAALDAVILGGLLSAFARRPIAALPAAVAALLSVVCGVWAFAPPPVPLYPLDTGIWVHPGAAVVHLQPHAWQGSPAPLRFGQAPGSNSAGTWYVLVRPSCPRCRKWARQYEDLARQEAVGVREVIVGEDEVQIGAIRYRICAEQDPVAFFVNGRGVVERVEAFNQTSKRRDVVPRCFLRYGAS